LKERLRSNLTSEELIKLEDNEMQESDLKIQNSSFKIPVIQPTAAAAMMYNMQYSTIQREKSKIAAKNNESNATSLLLNQQNRITSDGKVTSSLIAELLKKDSTGKSNKSFKLFPYVCLRCKKEVILCDSPAQTCQDDSNVRILDATPRNILGGDSLFKSKTIGNKLSDIRDETNGTLKHKKSDSASNINFQDKPNSLNRLQII
jgi:hypothetical protein